jgi:hypothetical protein
MSPLAKGWPQKISDALAIAKKGHIAMSQQVNAQPGEQDRVGRIIARDKRVRARIARQFDDPESRLAVELRDILSHMPEPVEDDPNAAWHIAPQRGEVDW